MNPQIKQAKLREEYEELFANRGVIGDRKFKDYCVGIYEDIADFWLAKTSQAKLETLEAIIKEVEGLATCGDCNGTGIVDCDKCEPGTHKCSRCGQSGEISITKADLLTKLRAEKELIENNK